MYQFENIKITEGNAFSLLIPLKKRTYVAQRPIDEDIDILNLQSVVVKFGGVEYPCTLQEDGVLVDFPADLKCGTYDLILTADYMDNAIRAAYFEAVTIVSYNYQSDAHNFVQGSPIVMQPAFVIYNLSDAELEQLKQQYREAIAAAEAAEEAAEQAKEDWEQKAAELDNVAQESTSQEILAILAAKTIPFTLGECEFVNTAEVQDCAGAMLNIANCTKLVSDRADVIAPQVRSGWTNIKEVYFNNAQKIESASSNSYSQTSRCEIYEAEKATSFTGTYAMFYNYIRLKRLNILSIYTLDVTPYFPNGFGLNNDLIDLVAGKNLHRSNIKSGNSSIFSNWNPTNALNADSTSLLTQEDLNAGFTSNLQKLLYNIREHFAANLADLTGQTASSITFHANIKAAILADQATADAFTNKNWIVA